MFITRDITIVKLNNTCCVLLWARNCHKDFVPYWRTINKLKLISQNSERLSKLLGSRFVSASHLVTLLKNCNVFSPLRASDSISLGMGAKISNFNKHSQWSWYTLSMNHSWTNTGHLVYNVPYFTRVAMIWYLWKHNEIYIHSLLFSLPNFYILPTKMGIYERQLLVSLQRNHVHKAKTISLESQQIFIKEIKMIHKFHKLVTALLVIISEVFSFLIFMTQKFI